VFVFRVNKLIPWLEGLFHYWHACLSQQPQYWLCHCSHDTLEVSKNVSFLIQLLRYFELAINTLALDAAEIIAVQISHLLCFLGSVTCALISIACDWTTLLVHDVPE
jgi:hypothetical protein